MDHNRAEFSYGKWDCAEDGATVFEKVKSGEWNKGRFDAWLDQYRVEVWRDATADENM